MAQEKNTFGGFELVTDFLAGNNRGSEVDQDLLDPSEMFNSDENELEIETEVEETDLEKSLKASKEVEDKTDDTEEEVDEPANEIADPVDTEGLSEAEPEIAAFVQEKIYDKLGWEFGEGEKKLQSIDEVVDYIQNLVDENSKPDYASDEIAELNAFVLNGGNIKNYFDTKYAGELDVNNIDLDNPITQSRIIRELFKEQGHDSDKIEKRIKRYEDTGVLEDEAKDAYEILIKNKEKKAQKLLVEQENLRKEAEKQQQMFFSDVTSNIKSIKDVKGIEVTTAEKTKLIDYIFKVESDGKTKYQKEYEASPLNLIESAYLQMTKKSLVDKLKNKATSGATQTLKKKLQSVKTGNRMRGSADDSGSAKRGDTSGFNVLTNLLQKPQ